MDPVAIPAPTPENWTLIVSIGIGMLAFGAALGWVVTWLICKARTEKRLAQQSTAALTREAELKAVLDQQRLAWQEKLKLLEDSQARMSDSFKALSAEALRNNQESFLGLAKTTLEKYQEGARGDLDKRQQAIGDLVKPVRESLDKVDAKIQQVEKVREGAYSELRNQVKTMTDTQRELQRETGQLVKALRKPAGRGQWGEMQLRRVVEMAGMQESCDFQTQVSTTDGEGKRLRPDLVVRLPAEKQIVVDAKTPMDAYLDALEARERGDEAEAQASMARHAQQVRNHITQLASKSYQSQFDPAPEFVVLFLPSESFFSDALRQDPGLIERGVDEGVILATPTTLIALLRAVAYGWRQEALAKNAVKISQLGRELYDRISTMTDHLTRLGKSLGGSVDAYNKALGTLESRVLVSARKFRELEAAPEGSGELESPPPIDSLTREVQADELRKALPEIEPEKVKKIPKEPKKPKRPQEEEEEGNLLPFDDFKKSVGE